MLFQIGTKSLFYAWEGVQFHAFLSSINMAVKYVNTYEHDIVKYLGLNPDDIYK